VLHRFPIYHRLSCRDKLNLSKEIGDAREISVTVGQQLIVMK